MRRRTLLLRGSAAVLEGAGPVARGNATGRALHARGRLMTADRGVPTVLRLRAATGTAGRSPSGTSRGSTGDADGDRDHTRSA